MNDERLPLPVTAVMGTIDEADNLRAVLPALAAIVREIVVVDDGSTDGSRDVAHAHGAIVVARPRRLGIGSAIYAGVACASLPVIAAMDADGSHPPRALVTAHALLQYGGYDLVRFSRFLPGATWDAPVARRIGLRLVARLLATTSGLPLTDPTNGFMLARRECFEGAARFVTDTGEGWVADFLARNRRRPMAELPYAHAARLCGATRGSRGREIARALRSLRFGIAGRLLR